MVPFERAMVVSYRLSIVTVALSVTIRPQFAIECLRRSNQLGVRHFGAKFGEMGRTRSKPNFDAIQERHGAVVRKRNCVVLVTRCGYLLPFEHNARTLRNVTDRQTDHGTVTSIPIGEIDRQRYRLIITRSQAVARIADRTASQHFRGSRDVIGHVII